MAANMDPSTKPPNNWISGAEPRSLAEDKPLTCQARIRHLGKMHKAKVTEDGSKKLKVEMEEPSFGIAPGQSAVFYKEDEVLGGGIIV